MIAAKPIGAVTSMWPRITSLVAASVVVIALLAGSTPAGAQALGFPDLVSGIEAIEGVVGVETAQTSSGKQLIFAWFEDKAAALRWYYSEMHRGVQDAFFPDRAPHVPLEHVPDDVGPIMAIASVTMADSAYFAETSLPISQIAIELYTPLPGGLFLGSRFTPDGVKVKGMRNVTPTGR